MEAFAISRTGLDVEWQRLQIVADNIANMNTSRTTAGIGYVPRALVSGPAGSFGKMVSEGLTERRPAGVAVYDIATLSGETRQVYDPRHPDADEAGFVSYPAISQANEMTMMVKASRAYEANLVAMSAALQMYSSALQIGRQA